MSALQNFIYKIVVVICRFAGISAPLFNPPELAVTAAAAVSGGTVTAADSGSSAAAVTVIEPPASARARVRASRVAKLVAIDKWVENKRGFLLIALSMVATGAMQASISPPGGLWTDDSLVVDLAGNMVLNKDGKPIYLGSAAVEAAAMYPHRAGYSILARNDPEGYWVYSTLNIEIVVSSAYLFIVLCSKLNTWHYAFSVLVSVLWTCVSATFINFMYVSYALRPPKLADANTHLRWMHPIFVLIVSPVPPLALLVGSYLMGMTAFI